VQPAWLNRSVYALYFPDRTETEHKHPNADGKGFCPKKTEEEKKMGKPPGSRHILRTAGCLYDIVRSLMTIVTKGPIHEET